MFFQETFFFGGGGGRKADTFRGKLPPAPSRQNPVVVLSVLVWSFDISRKQYEKYIYPS